jgi:regulator of sirC expression with transglutaminase-like and TPR domain
MMHLACERWARLTDTRSQEVSLAEGALLIAADEYENLDVDGYLMRIEDMAAALRRRLRSDIGPTEALLALNRYVFDELGFTGNTDDYYDPRNSFLNDVIERKLGIPITLAVLYIEIGRRIGLPLEGVSFPAHFLVKCVLREGTIVIDPYARGVSLAIADLQQRLKPLSNGIELDPAVVTGLLAAAGPKDILARMLRKLCAIYRKRRETLKALAATNRIVALLPESADDYRERGELHAELECFRAGLDDFRHYLKLKPDAHDSETVARRIAELEPLVARLN